MGWHQALLNWNAGLLHCFKSVATIRGLETFLHALLLSSKIIHGSRTVSKHPAFLCTCHEETWSDVYWYDESVNKAQLKASGKPTRKRCCNTLFVCTRRMKCTELESLEVGEKFIQPLFTNWLGSTEYLDSLRCVGSWSFLRPFQTLEIRRQVAIANARW